MDVDVAAIEAWALRAKAEGYLRSFLSELAHPTLDGIRSELGGNTSSDSAARMLMSGKSATQPIVAWRDQPHIAYAVPAAIDEERMRIQFAASDGVTYFSVEARYQHPRESIDLPAVDVATRALQGDGFSCGNDGYGFYWANVLTADQWAHPHDSLDRLMAFMATSIKQIAASGLFAALEELQPSTPSSAPPEEQIG